MLRGYVLLNLHYAIKRNNSRKTMDRILKLFFPGKEVVKNRNVGEKYEFR